MLNKMKEVVCVCQDMKEVIDLVIIQEGVLKDIWSYFLVIYLFFYCYLLSNFQEVVCVIYCKIFQLYIIYIKIVQRVGEVQSQSVLCRNYIFFNFVINVVYINIL